MSDITLHSTLHWADVAAIATGAKLQLSDDAWNRLDHANRIVHAIIASGVRAYGVNTGVGALSDTVVSLAQQAQLSRNLVMSHACATGPLMERQAVRAILAAQINNLAHGHSGTRPAVIRHYQTMLNHDLTPEVPSKGSVGYLVHNAHMALVLIGQGRATLNGQSMPGAEALSAIGLEPLVLEAKEGLSLLNGSACATGLACLALARAARFLDWADQIAALTMEAALVQTPAFAADVLALRPSAGIQQVGETLRNLLSGSALLAGAQGAKTQDALSLRAVPLVHGAARDAFAEAARVVDQELASVSDNPAISGTPEKPVVSSEAHAVAPALAHALDSLAIALAQMSGMSERRLDRLVNPLVSGLPPFLARDPGAGSGFMIAQYTAAGLAIENRQLAMPLSTQGGITSALQEDFLVHPTPSAQKLLTLIDNAEQILAIEYAAALEAHDAREALGKRAAGTDRLYALGRTVFAAYADDRPLGPDLEAVKGLLQG